MTGVADGCAGEGMGVKMRTPVAASRRLISLSLPSLACVRCLWGLSARPPYAGAVHARGCWRVRR